MISKTPTTATRAVPEWAERWLPGKCGCGGRLVEVACWCGSHTACASSGWGIEKCPDANNGSPA